MENMSFFSIWAEEDLARSYWQQGSQRVAINPAESFLP